MIPAAICLALASALFYAISAVLQEREASKQEDAGGLALLGRLARRRGWWAAVLATLVGASLHLCALAAGPLVVVQPLGVSCLAIALVIGSRVHRTPVGRRSWIGAACVVLGLPAVLAAVPHHAGGPLHPTEDALGFVPVTAIVAGLVVLATLAAVILGRSRPRAEVICYALGAAMCFGVASTTAKTLFLGHFGPIRLGVMIVAALLGTLLAQHAYRDGGLGAPLAVLTLMDPVTAGAMGVLVLGEPFGATPLALVFGVVGALVTATGVVLLSVRKHPGPVRPEPVLAGTG
ncbi:hypothetical protein GCM10009836_47810 [Pseudonocardia ailaonensis]|uniref:Magnesium transporter NIPA n=1 Tax=Pseudonocardia ailaonensis TaxID=367279 RepID=A0ABN2NFL6_9PSEU